MTELLVVNQIDVNAPRGNFGVRCHSGVLAVGDHVTTAIDLSGTAHEINLTCVEIRLAENILLNTLDANYGGLVILEGEGIEMVDVGWHLRS